MHLPAPQFRNPQHLRQAAGRVCVAVAGAAMFADAARSAARTRFVEFRLDSVPDPESMLPQLRHFLAEHPTAIAVATCRRQAYGGGFAGTAAEQLDLLTQAAQAGCALADIEVETAEELGPSALQTLRYAGAAVIVSWHDFHATPPMEPMLQRMARVQPDYRKLVPTAQTLRDAMQVLDLLETHGQDGRLIAMSMGMKGVPTRVLGPRFGSAFTFASADGSDGTAPGQVSISTLLDLYRIESITPDTAIYAVAGQPIGGSLSPRMHNTAFRALAMDAVYLPLETAAVDDLMAAVERLQLRGLSVTMPLKEPVMPLLAYEDATVKAIRACNTLLRHSDGALAGFNSDVSGVVEPLKRRMDLHGAHVLVLGAGGAARAAVYGLQTAGAKVSVLNRTASRAYALAAEFGVDVQTRETLSGRHFHVIVNSTPYGMRGQAHTPPILPAEMNCNCFFDLVYNPVQTPLMQVAAARGIPTVPGVAMFVEQGVRQFELWTERTAPEGDMMQTVLSALDN